MVLNCESNPFSQAAAAYAVAAASGQMQICLELSLSWKRRREIEFYVCTFDEWLGKLIVQRARERVQSSRVVGTISINPWSWQHPIICRALTHKSRIPSDISLDIYRKNIANVCGVAGGKPEVGGTCRCWA